jgi:hypothetical protein
MAGGGLPPPPTRAESGDFAWTAWYNQLYTLLSTQGSVSWDLVNKAGSSIADLQNKNHGLLTNILGTGQYHISSAEATNVTALPNISGNAATATNVAYSGLTGTVPTWNQNTTGNAATATNVAYSGLTGTVPTWNQDTTGSSNLLAVQSKSSDPTTSDIAASKAAVYKNTTSGLVKLWTNDGGTMKSVLLT